MVMGDRSVIYSPPQLMIPPELAELDIVIISALLELPSQFTNNSDTVDLGQRSR